MSLGRRFFFVFSLLVCGILIVNTWLSLKSSERHLNAQLAVLAQDTATSLGLTVSHVARDGDPAIIQTMMNVIFDRGYYASILYSDVNGRVVASRSRRMRVSGVPQWFVDIARLPMHAGKADVVSGWHPLGVISVVVHPGVAYQNLWRDFKDQLWVFLFSMVLLYLLVGQLVRVILRPLNDVEKQAQALIDKQFITQLNLPRTSELKRVVVAMNVMVAKVREMFAMQVETISDLRQSVATDKLTGLMNKAEFDAQVNTWLRTDAAEGAGALMLIRANHLKQVNDELGLDAADQWLCDIARHLQYQTQHIERVFLSRRGGGDFSLFLPGCDFAHAQHLSDVILALSDSAPIGRVEQALYIGAVTFSEGIKLPYMLSAVDASLREALEQDTSHACIDVYDPDKVILPANKWREKLNTILEEKSLFFYTQSVLPSKSGSPLYHEVLARIKSDGQLINAGAFWPLVERFNLQVAFDRLVIEQVLIYLDKLTKNPDKLGVNISTASLQSPDFLTWLESSVLRSENAMFLVFEISESALVEQNAAFERFTSLIKQSKAQLALGRFGLMPSSLGCLQSVPIDYVKIDQRFVVDIDTNTQNQFYTKHLINIVKSCDVTIIAHGVETNNQWEALKLFGVDAGQGYYLNSPCEPK